MKSNYTPQEKAAYSKIKEYVKDKYGVNVYTLDRLQLTGQIF